MRIVMALVLLCGVAHADPKLTTSVDVPTVARGTDAPPSWPILSATKQVIVIDGKPLIEIKNGDVDPSEKEGGAMGLKLPRIATFMGAYVKESKTPPTGMLVALDQTTPYHLMIELLYSLKTTGIKNFDFVAKSGGKLGVIPLTLPEATPAAAIAKPAKNPPVQPVVAVTKDKILVWSMSGTEGTLQKPKATLALTELDKLTQTLAAIKKRHAPETSLIVMCDGATPMSTVLALIAAIRTSSDGTALYPDVRLSGGFE